MGILERGKTGRLFRGRYRVDTKRLKGWNYSWPGWYFVTICTRHRFPWFGCVVNDSMELSSIGQIVAEEWSQTAIVRPYVALDEWTVMPDHFHGIIVITDSAPPAARSDASSVATTRRVVAPTNIGHIKPSTLHPRSLGAIVGQFKSVSTKRIRAAGFDHFAWQGRFYDRIIRDHESLDRIRDYIRNNPRAWSARRSGE